MSFAGSGELTVVRTEGRAQRAWGSNAADERLAIRGRVSIGFAACG